MPPATRRRNAQAKTPISSSQAEAPQTESKIPAPSSKADSKLGLSQSSIPVPASKSKLSLPASRKRKESLTNAAKNIPEDLVSPVNLKFGKKSIEASQGKGTLH